MLRLQGFFYLGGGDFCSIAPGGGGRFLGETRSQAVMARLPEGGKASFHLWEDVPKGFVATGASPCTDWWPDGGSNSGQSAHHNPPAPLPGLQWKARTGGGPASASKGRGPASVQATPSINSSVYPPMDLTNTNFHSCKTQVPAKKKR